MADTAALQIIRSGQAITYNWGGSSMEIKIKKVSNGFILNVNYAEYVFTSMKAMQKWISDYYKPKKEEKK